MFRSSPRYLFHRVSLAVGRPLAGFHWRTAKPPTAAPPAAPELRVFDPSLIDKTVDPCDNFYRYSCNGWFKRNPLPADQIRMAASPSCMS
jgi:putative endopeptidase